MNLHLLFLAGTFKSRSIKLAFEAPIFLYSVDVAIQQTIIISAERKLRVTSNINPSWYSWTFLMPYSKEKKKNNDNRHQLVSYHSEQQAYHILCTCPECTVGFI
jgi:hypothetical protein